MVFYLRRPQAECSAPALPLSLYGLSAYIAAGYRYAVLDRHASSLSSLIRVRARRVAHYPALGPLSVGESLISSENSHSPNPSEPVEYVDVYDLSGMHLPGPGVPDPRLCNANTPV
jgi:hypothetical protein